MSAVESINSQINESAERMSQQESSIQNIVDSSAKMEDVCQVNANLSEELSNSADSLLNIADRLVQLSHIMSDTVQKAENIDELKPPEDTGTAEFF